MATSSDTAKAEDLIEDHSSALIKSSMNQAFEDGFAAYKQIIEEFLETKAPHTTSEIQDFQSEARNQCVQAFEDTYPNLEMNDPTLVEEFTVAKLKLENAISASTQALLYVTKHTDYMEDTIATIKEYTVVCLEFYDAKMEAVNASQSTGKIITLKHTMTKFEAMRKFEALLHQHGLVMQPWHKKELEYKLEDKLQDLFTQSSQNEKVTRQSFKNGENSNTTKNDVQPQNLNGEEIIGVTIEAQEEPQTPMDFSVLALPLNVSIYMDQDAVTVATADASQLDIIKTLPARMALETDQILIGYEARKHRECGNYFNIYELVKQQQSTSHFIYLTDFCTTICTEELLALFFRTLQKEILRLKSATILGNIVVTTAFACTAKEKERLKLSMRMAEWKDIRLLSSSLTTAVAFSKQSLYFLRKPTQKKTFLVIQYLKDSFTMAAEEVEPRSISTKIASGSMNLKECQVPDYLMNHAQMCESQGSEVYRNVYLSYRKVGKYIIDFMQGVKIEKIVVVKISSEPTTLDRMLEKLFGIKIDFIVVNDGPILGASIFSSREYQFSYFPKHISVNDYFSTDFILVHDEEILEKISTKVISEYRLCCKMDMKDKGSIRVLEKIFDDNYVEFCNFYLDTSEEDSPYEICLFEKIDEDGVYSIKVDIPKYVKGSVIRVDNILLKQSDPLAGTRLDKLTQHYEEINAKSLKKEYYQLYFI